LRRSPAVAVVVRAVVDLVLHAISVYTMRQSTAGCPKPYPTYSAVCLSGYAESFYILLELLLATCSQNLHVAKSSRSSKSLLIVAAQMLAQLCCGSQSLKPHTRLSPTKFPTISHPDMNSSSTSASECECAFWKRQVLKASSGSTSVVSTSLARLTSRA